MQKNSGFSIVELLVVFGIITVLVGLAIPNIVREVADNRLKRAATNTVGAMQLAKMGAVKDNRDWAILFDTAGNSYRICSDSGDGDWSTAANNVCQGPVSYTEYESNVGYGHGDATKQANTDRTAFTSGYDNVSYNGNRVIFNSKGMADKVGYVYLSNRYNTAYAVGTQSMAGSVIVKKWTGNDWNPK